MSVDHVGDSHLVLGQSRDRSASPVSASFWSSKASGYFPARTDIVYDVTEEYAAELCVLRGFSSVTFIHNLASDIVAYRKHDLRSHVLVLTDLDPSGVVSAASFRSRPICRAPGPRGARCRAASPAGRCTLRTASCARPARAAHRLVRRASALRYVAFAARAASVGRRPFRPRPPLLAGPSCSRGPSQQRVVCGRRPGPACAESSCGRWRLLDSGHPGALRLHRPAISVELGDGGVPLPRLRPGSVRAVAQHHAIHLS